MANGGFFGGVSAGIDRSAKRADATRRTDLLAQGTDLEKQKFALAEKTFNFQSDTQRVEAVNKTIQETMDALMKRKAMASSKDDAKLTRLTTRMSTQIRKTIETLNKTAGKQLLDPDQEQQRFIELVNSAPFGDQIAQAKGTQAGQAGVAEAQQYGGETDKGTRAALTAAGKLPGAPEIKTVREGDQDVAYQYDATSGKYVKMASGEAFAPGKPSLGKIRVGDKEVAGILDPENKTFTPIKEAVGEAFAPKSPTLVKYRSGDQEVSAILDPDGTINEVSQGEAFSPKQRGETDQGLTREGLKNVVEGASARPADVPEYQSATGGSGFFGNIVNTVADAFGTEKLPADRIEQATADVNAFNQNIRQILTANVPGRPSNYVREQVEQLVFKPGSLLQGDQRALNKLNSLSTYIESQMPINRSVIENFKSYEAVKEGDKVVAAATNLGQMIALKSVVDEMIANAKGRKKTGTRNGLPGVGEKIMINGVEVERLN